MLTLVVIPVVYDLLDRRGDEYYRNRVRKAEREARVAADKIGHDNDPLAETH
ncbi:hypothetical protein D3C71_1780810 [compost metagenome]